MTLLYHFYREQNNEWEITFQNSKIEAFVVTRSIVYVHTHPERQADPISREAHTHTHTHTT